MPRVTSRQVLSLAAASTAALPLALILAAVPAAPVAARPAFDIAPTRDCLAATAPERRGACIGRAADACLASPEGGTTVGMGYCLEQEYRFWDDELNRLYTRLRARLREIDRENADYPVAISMADALRDMQRAWIAYRDATCDFERAQWMGGTGGGPATMACLMRLTGQQALYLDQTLEGF